MTNIKNLRTKCITGFIATATIASFIVPTTLGFVQANELNASSNQSTSQLASSSDVLSSNIEIALPKIPTVKKVALESLFSKGVFNTFELDENGNLKQLNIVALTEKFALTEAEIGILNEINQTNAFSILQKEQRISFSHGSSWVKVSLTYNETVAYVSSAAQIGPAALLGAMYAISSLIGPAGPMITTVLGIIGAAGLVDGCYTIMRAVSNHKGVYLEAGLDGFLPYINFGY
jgi:hypothetical protein